MTNNEIREIRKEIDRLSIMKDFLYEEKIKALRAKDRTRYEKLSDDYDDYSFRIHRLRRMLKTNNA